MADERWVPTIGYELIKTDDRYHIYRRGGLYVRSYIPDDEIAMRPYASAADYDAGIAILRSLRGALGPTPPTAASENDVL